MEGGELLLCLSSRLFRVESAVIFFFFEGHRDAFTKKKVFMYEAIFVTGSKYNASRCKESASEIYICICCYIVKTNMLTSLHFDYTLDCQALKEGRRDSFLLTQLSFFIFTTCYLFFFFCIRNATFH